MNTGAAGANVIRREAEGYAGPPMASWENCERRRRSVNTGAEVQTRTGRVRKSSRAMGARRGRLSSPWLRFHSVGRVDV